MVDLLIRYHVTTLRHCSLVVKLLIQVICLLEVNRLDVLQRGVLPVYQCDIITLILDVQYQFLKFSLKCNVVFSVRIFFLTIKKSLMEASVVQW